MLKVAEVVEDLHEAFYLDIFWVYFHKLYHSQLLLSEDVQILEQYAPVPRKFPRHPTFTGLLRFTTTGSFLIGSAFEGTMEAVEAFGVLSYDFLYHGYKKRCSIYNFDLMMLQFMKLRECKCRILRYFRKRMLYFDTFKDAESRVLDILMEKDYKFIFVVTRHLSTIVATMQELMMLLLKNINAETHSYTQIMLYDYIKIIDGYTIIPSILFRQFQKFEDLITLITSNFLSCIVFATSQKEDYEKIAFIKYQVGTVISKLAYMMKKHMDEIYVLFEEKQMNDDTKNKEKAVAVKEKPKPVGNLAVTKFMDLYLANLQIARDSAIAINEAYKEGAYETSNLHGELQKLAGQHDRARTYVQMLIGLTIPKSLPQQKSDLDLKFQAEPEVPRVVSPVVTVSFDDPEVPITDEEYEMQMNSKDEFTQTLYDYCMETQTDESQLRRNAKLLLEELSPLLEEIRNKKAQEAEKIAKRYYCKIPHVPPPPPPPPPGWRVDSEGALIPPPPPPPPLPGSPTYLTDEEVKILQNERRAIFQDICDRLKASRGDCKQDVYGDED